MIKFMFKFIGWLTILIVVVTIVWFGGNWYKAGQTIRDSEAFSVLGSLQSVSSFLPQERLIFDMHALDSENVWPCRMIYFKRGASQFVLNDFIQKQNHFDRAFLACRLEADFGTDTIRRYFLDAAFVGNGEYGIETFAQSEFNKPIAELTFEESIMIGVIIKSPWLRNDPEEMNRRVQYWIEKMGDPTELTFESN